jgi:site-specific recombinase XerD
VFTTGFGTPYEARNLIRHTFDSMIFDQGIDLKIVSELLSHQFIQISAKVNTHTSHPTLRLVANKLSDGIMSDHSFKKADL